MKACQYFLRLIRFRSAKPSEINFINYSATSKPRHHIVDTPSPKN